MKLNLLRKYFALSAATVLAASSNSVLASAPASISQENQAITANSSADAVIAYWSPARLRAAKSLDQPIATLTPAVVPSTTEPRVSGSGKGPTDAVAPNTQPMFTPQIVNSAGVQPSNVGTSGAPFTSSRLIPLSADQAYPYVTTGKLFFTQPGVGDFVCSASVLRPRVVLTAGHCVHKGSGGSNGFYTNWLFIPAYRDGAAPYGKWAWSWVITTGEWSTGNGKVPNAADFAIIEVKDQTISGKVRKIADLTGYLGYQTQSLLSNHATLLGYPCNLDSCQKMHQVTAQSYKANGTNTVLYGSDMTGGSSGGPWIQNFGAPATGQTTGQNTGVNRVIGVTSYIYTDGGKLLVEGSSILNNSFLDILNKACAHKAGNCP